MHCQSSLADILNLSTYCHLFRFNLFFCQCKAIYIRVGVALVTELKAKRNVAVVQQGQHCISNMQVLDITEQIGAVFHYRGNRLHHILLYNCYGNIMPCGTNTLEVWVTDLKNFLQSLYNAILKNIWVTVNIPLTSSLRLIIMSVVLLACSAVRHPLSVRIRYGQLCILRLTAKTH